MSQPLVLVVEDEPLLRLHAVTMLEDAGYATLEAGSADEAIAHLESNADIHTRGAQPAPMDGNAVMKIRSRIANAAALGPADMNAETGTGDPW